MKITITNDFHGTSSSFEPVETYISENGQPCAVVADEDWLRMNRELCGMPDCRCARLSTGALGQGDDGVRYACV